MANLTDTFDGILQDADLAGRTSDSGHVWAKALGGTGGTKIQGRTSLASQTLAYLVFGDSAAPVVAYRSDVVPAAADYDVNGVIFKWSSDPAQHEFVGVAARMDAGMLNGYLAGWSPSTRTWRILRADAGVWTVLGSYDPLAYLTDEVDHPFKLELRGSTLKLFVGGTERISVTDNTYTAAGVIGIAGKRGATVNTTFDHCYLNAVSSADYVPAVVADRINITTQPAVTYTVGDTVTIVAAAQDASGNTQTDYAPVGQWKLRVRSGPPEISTTYALDSDQAVNGVVALTWVVTTAGTYTFGVDDDANVLTDSAASTGTTVTMPAGGGGATVLILGDDMASAELDGTSQSVDVEVYNTDGTDAALTSASAGLTIQYRRGLEAWVSVTPAALASDNAAWAVGGIRNLGGALHRVDLPDVAFATATAGGSVLYVKITATGVRTRTKRFDLLPTRDAFEAGVAGEVAGHATITGIASDAAQANSQATLAAAAAAGAEAAAESADAKLNNLNVNVDLTETNGKLDELLGLDTGEWERTPNSIIGYLYEVDEAGVRTGRRATITYASATSNVAVKRSRMQAF